MVSTVHVCAILDHELDSDAVTGGNRSKEFLRFTDVDLFAPFSDVDGLETS